MRIQVGNEIVEIKPPSFSGKGIFGVIAAIVLLIAVLSSFYTVQVEEAGVVMRFGKHIGTVEPGLHFKVPFGIDQVITVPVRRQQKQEFGFGTSGNTNPYQWTNPGEMELEKNMVTGDLNAALVEWVIQYRIT
ncbi:MAG: SPFH domain-containing protein, partial [Verrucomicrobiota bacterium]